MVSQACASSSLLLIVRERAVNGNRFVEGVWGLQTRSHFDYTEFKVASRFHIVTVLGLALLSCNRAGLEPVVRPSRAFPRSRIEAVVKVTSAVAIAHRLLFV